MITSPGVGSGLDINTLVSQLVAAQAEPTVVRLDRQEAQFLGKISGLGQLKSALSAFGTALTALKQSTTFQSQLAASSNSDLFTASAVSGAAPGSYSVEAIQLAAPHKLASGGFADAEAVVGTGELTLSSGSNVFTVNVAAGSETLGDVRDAINTAPGNTSVNASIVNVDDGAGGVESRLLLTARETGKSNAITALVSDDDGNDVDAAGLSQLAYDPAGSGAANLSELQAASNAHVRVDTLDIFRASNTVSDAIDGVTLDLVSASPGFPTTLTVGPDTASVVGAVDEFVSSHNTLRQTIAELSRFDALTGERGVLLGDSSLISISTQVQRVLGGSVEVDSAAFQTLSGIGVRTQVDGTLSVDTGVLTAALDSDAAGVEQLFASSDGFAVRLDAIVDGLTSASGALESRTRGLSERIDGLNDQRDALDRRLVSLEQRLLSQFNAMDAIVGQLQATGDFLSQQFAALQSSLKR